MEDYIGTIRMFGGYFAPMGFTFCDGKLLSTKEHPALYSILGTTYGGDGINNFAVPDLRPSDKTYEVKDAIVKRARESGDPGTFGFLENTEVLEINHKIFDWGNHPRYIICVDGIYPSRD